MELDGGLNLLRGEGVLLGVDHELAGLLHDLLEELDHDVVEKRHARLRDGEVRLHLLEHAEDVGLEGVLVPQLQRLLRSLGVPSTTSRNGFSRLAGNGSRRVVGSLGAT